MRWLERQIERIERGHICHVISAGAAIGGIAALASAATSIGMEASGAGKTTAKNVTANPNAVNYGGLTAEQKTAGKGLADAQAGMKNLTTISGNAQDIQKWVSQGYTVDDWARAHPGQEGSAQQYNAAKGAVDAAQQAADNAPTAVQQMDAAQKQTMQGNVDASNRLANQGMSEYSGLSQADTQTAQAAQGRQGVTLDPSIQQGYQGMATGQGPMGQSTALWQNAALGNGPSAAQSQFQSAIDQNIRSQQSLAAGARGGALSMASAQRHAMDNAGQMTAQAASQSASLRANEMQNAMSGFSQAQQAGMAGMSGAATTQANLSSQQRALNDQASMHYSDLAHQDVGSKYGLGAANLSNVQNLQQQSYGNTQGLMANQMSAGQYQTGVDQANANRQAGVDAHNAAITQQNITGAVGGITSGLAGAATSFAPPPSAGLASAAPSTVNWNSGPAAAGNVTAGKDPRRFNETLP